MVAREGEVRPLSACGILHVSITYSPLFRFYMGCGIMSSKSYLTVHDHTVLFQLCHGHLVAVNGGYECLDVKEQPEVQPKQVKIAGCSI